MWSWLYSSLLPSHSWTEIQTWSKHGTKMASSSTSLQFLRFNLRGKAGPSGESPLTRGSKKLEGKRSHWWASQEW